MEQSPGLFEEALGETVDTVRRLPRSLWALVRRPGSLSRAWVDGTRGTLYLPPVRLFLAVAVVFFVAGPWIGGRDHMAARFVDGMVSGVSEGWSVQTEGRAPTSLPGLKINTWWLEFVDSHFEGILLVILLPVFTLLLYGARGWKGRPSEYGVLAFDCHAFGLLVALLFLPFGAVLGKAGLAAETALIVGYLAMAIRHMYGESWRTVLGQSVAVTYAYALVTLGLGLALAYFG